MKFNISSLQKAAVVLFLVSFVFFSFVHPAQRTEHIRINGTDYDIPASYFGVVPFYIKDLEIYLLMDRTSLEPLGVMSHSGRKTSENLLSILSHDPVYLKSIDELVPMFQQITHRTVEGPNIFGLISYVPPLGGSDMDHGELYVSFESPYKTVIHCSDSVLSGKYTVGNPLCDQYFDDGYLIQQISYQKKYLKDWKEAQDKVGALFTKFRKSAESKSLDKVKIQKRQVEPMLTGRGKAHPEREKSDNP